MLNPPDRGVSRSTAPQQKIKISFAPLDRYLHRNLGQPTHVGDVARVARILIPGLTPAGLRNRVVRAGDLALLRKADAVLAAFRLVERDVKGAGCHLPKQQGGRRNG